MRRISSVFVLAALTQIGATDCGTVIRDSGFDLWCGDELCAWKVERGEVKRVPTWNKGDSGVELVGPDTAIAQLSPVDSSDGYCREDDDGTHCEYPANVCIEISMIANVDKNAVVDLSIDVFGDGTAEFNERLPTANWKPLSYRVVVGKPFAGIRFQLAKAGNGTAQLANIGAKLAKNCEGLPVIEPTNVPLGSPCLQDDDCASGICGAHAAPAPFEGVTGFATADKVCLACDATHACGAGEICGLGPAASPVREAPSACVAIGSKQLGEQCNADQRVAGLGTYVSECASGYCTSHMCSTCTPTPASGRTTGCASDETCGPAITSTWPDVHYSAYACSPHGQRRAAGEPCLDHDDCTSGACAGAERQQCDDGRQCGTPLQCPFADGLQYGECSTVGIQGGTCQ